MIVKLDFQPSISKIPSKNFRSKSSLVQSNLIIKEIGKTKENYFAFPKLKKKQKKARITLEMPSINTRFIRKPLYVKPDASMGRTSSVSTHSKKLPEPETKTLRQTTISFDMSLAKESSYVFSPVRSKNFSIPKKITKNKFKTIEVPELIIKGGKKNDRDKSFDSFMHAFLIDYYYQVKSKYLPIYLEIDRTNKGYFDVDDIIDYHVLKDFESQDKNYGACRSVAKELHNILMIISKSSKIYLKHFLAFCSVFEHNKGEDLILNSREVLKTIKEQIVELKELFECYADKVFIDIRAVINDLNIKENIPRSRIFLESEKIDFVRFLRCLPFFVWIYNSMIR